jgi:thiamine-phosphate pyrophosphorylase
MQACGVDYIGNGPFRFTSTKENLNPVLGIEGVRAIADQCRLAGIALPVIAIGGIRQEDIGALLEAGVHGVAVSSAINHAASRPGAAGAFIRELNRYTIHS